MSTCIGTARLNGPIPQKEKKINLALKQNAPIKESTSLGGFGGQLVKLCNTLYSPLSTLHSHPIFRRIDFSRISG
ncbi:hypothetical protein V6N11_057149 [Hibiscus sabdariffa]|uniref:Uncharacterized protein n=2 Tax=Hibiscus sabdariffa TaxID=183260 RepID=A0ABR2A3Z3_9ROSI